MRMLTTKEWNEVQSYKARLIAACKMLEDHWRMIVVVCGKPDTQEGFEQAWRNEDEASYLQWYELKKGLE